MKLLKINEFMDKKQSDTLCIMGSGWSINESRRIDKLHWDYDTIGFNWYCKNMLPTTFYLIREQCVAPKRCEKGNQLPDFYYLINSDVTTLIVKNKRSKHDTFNHVDNLDKLENDGIVVKDLIGNTYSVSDFRRIPIFQKGIIHGKNTLWDTLHFGVWMGYKMIVFVGIDLYDSRYFWLGKDETRELLAAGKRKCSDVHKQKSNVMSLVKKTQRAYPGINFYVENPKSELAQILRVLP